MPIPDAELDAALKAARARPLPAAPPLTARDPAGTAALLAEHKLGQTEELSALNDNPTGLPGEVSAEGIRRTAAETGQVGPTKPGPTSVWDAFGNALLPQTTLRWGDLSPEEQATYPADDAATYQPDSQVPANLSTWERIKQELPSPTAIKEGIENIPGRVVDFSQGVTKIVGAPVMAQGAALSDVWAALQGHPSALLDIPHDATAAERSYAGEGFSQGISSITQSPTMVHGHEAMTESNAGRLMRVAGTVIPAVLSTPAHETLAEGGVIHDAIAPYAEAISSHAEAILPVDKIARLDPFWREPSALISKEAVEAELGGEPRAESNWTTAKPVGDLLVRYAQDIQEGRNFQPMFTEAARTKGFKPGELGYDSMWWAGLGADMSSAPERLMSAGLRKPWTVAEMAHGAYKLPGGDLPKATAAGWRELVTPGSLDAAAAPEAMVLQAHIDGEPPSALPADFEAKLQQAAMEHEVDLAALRREQVAEPMTGPEYARPRQAGAPIAVDVEWSTEPGTDLRTDPWGGESWDEVPPSPKPGDGAAYHTWEKTEPAKKPETPAAPKKRVPRKAAPAPVTPANDVYESPDIAPSPAADFADTAARFAPKEGAEWTGMGPAATKRETFDGPIDTRAAVDGPADGTYALRLDLDAAARAGDITSEAAAHALDTAHKNPELVEHHQKLAEYAEKWKDAEQADRPLVKMDIGDYVQDYQAKLAVHAPDVVVEEIKAREAEARAQIDALPPRESRDAKQRRYAAYVADELARGNPIPKMGAEAYDPAAIIPERKKLVGAPSDTRAKIKAALNTPGHAPKDPRALVDEVFGDKLEARTPDQVLADLGAKGQKTRRAAGLLAENPAVRKLEPHGEDVKGAKYVVKNREGRRPPGMEPMPLSKAVEYLNKHHREPGAGIFIEGSNRRVGGWASVKGRGVVGELRADHLGASVFERAALEDHAVTIEPLTKAERKGPPMETHNFGAGAAGQEFFDAMGAAFRKTDLEELRDRLRKDAGDDPVLLRRAEAQIEYAALVGETARAILRSRLGSSRLINMGGLLVTQLEATRIAEQVQSELKGTGGADLHAAFLAHHAKGLGGETISLSPEEYSRFEVLYHRNVKRGKLNEDMPVLDKNGTLEKPFGAGEMKRTLTMEEAVHSGQPFAPGITRTARSVRFESGRWEITTQQQRELVDALMQKTADRMAWQSAAFRDNPAFSVNIMQRLERMIGSGAEQMSLPDQARWARARHQLQGVGKMVHHDIVRAREMDVSHADSLAFVLRDSIEPMSPLVRTVVRDIVNGRGALPKDSIPAMAEVFEAHDAKIMPPKMLKAIQAGDPEAVIAWGQRRARDARGQVEAWVHARAPHLDAAEVGHVMDTIDVDAVHHEVFGNGKLDGTAIEEAIAEINPKPLPALDLAAWNLAVYLRSHKVMASSVDDLLAADLALRFDDPAYEAAKAILTGKHKYQMKRADGVMVTITSAADPAAFYRAQRFIDRNGLRDGAKLVKKLDGTIVMPDAFARDLERAAAYGRVDSSATALAGIPGLTGEVAQKLHRWWKAVTTVWNQGNLLNNYLGAPEQVTATLGFKDAKGAAVQMKDPISRGLGARLGFERSRRSVKLGGHEINLMRRWLDNTRGGRTMIDVHGRIWTLDELERAAIEHGVNISSGQAEIGQALLDDLRRYDENGFGARAVSTLTHAPQDIVEIANAGEMGIRAAVFVDQLKQGKPVEVAALKARQALYDPTSLTDAERKYARLIIPFYTWYRNNIVAMTRAAIERPEVLAYWLKQARNMRSVLSKQQRYGMTDRENSELSISRPYKVHDEQGHVRSDIDRINIHSSAMPKDAMLGFYGQIFGAVLSGGNPLEGAANIAVENMDPVLKFLFESASHHDTTTGVPLDSDRANRLPAYFMSIPVLSEMTDALFHPGRRPIGRLDPTAADGIDEQGRPYILVAGADDSLTDAERENAKELWRILTDAVGRITTDSVVSILQLYPPLRPDWETDDIAIAKAMGFHTTFIPTSEREQEIANYKAAPATSDKAQRMEAKPGADLKP